jgi:hypothetical protein
VTCSVWTLRNILVNHRPVSGKGVRILQTRLWKQLASSRHPLRCGDSGFGGLREGRFPADCSAAVSVRLAAIGVLVSLVGVTFGQSPTITEYATPTTNSHPRTIVPGPDGALWFTEVAAVGRITTAGAITEFPISFPRSTGTAFGPHRVRMAPSGLWHGTAISGGLRRLALSPRSPLPPACIFSCRQGSCRRDQRPRSPPDRACASVLDPVAAGWRLGGSVRYRCRAGSRRAATSA